MDVVVPAYLVVTEQFPLSAKQATSFTSPLNTQLSSFISPMSSFTTPLRIGMSVGMGMVNFNKNGVGLESNSTFKLANQLMPSSADSTPSTSGKPIKAV
ncbi:unnamed protein product [Timema podura]|uniref:Uncharacterized protein n=1 Tax=Timema podura TaxID=61482 RepID=A0ABN7NKH9_TIMPD|nr:unnamed protein product [Timema podura]